jgi:hypothetical protein
MAAVGIFNVSKIAHFGGHFDEKPYKGISNDSKAMEHSFDWHS